MCQPFDLGGTSLIQAKLGNEQFKTYQPVKVNPCYFF
jgi:hypothetical protein